VGEWSGALLETVRLVARVLAENKIPPERRLARSPLSTSTLSLDVHDEVVHLHA